MAAEGVDAYFGAQARAHALADRVHARRGRGQGRRALRPVPRRRATTVDRPRRLALHDPGPPRGAGRRVDEIGYDLPGAWPRLLGSLGRAAASRSRRRPSPTPCGSASRPPRPTSSSSPVEGWVEALRADKTPDEVERIAAACAVADRALAALLPGDPARRDRAGPRAAPRVADPDRRRGGARVRRRLPRRARGGAAARLARATGRSSRARCCCSTSAPRWTATGAT